MESRPIEIPKGEPYIWIYIYVWFNTLNGKCYVGQTINEKDRYRKHIQDSFNRNSRGYNYHLHRAIRKYGLENFEYYINKYDSFKNGYNMTEGGDGVKGHQWTLEERLQQSQKIKGKLSGCNNPMYNSKWNQKQKDANQTKVLKYTVDGEYVAEYESIAKAAQSVGANNTGNISNCCRGLRNKAYGYIWKYKQRDEK